jgi:hypothetical protein
MDLKTISKNKEQVLINLIHVQERLVGEHPDITKNWSKKIQICYFLPLATVLAITRDTYYILI